MKLYNIVSKLTGHTETIDKETMDQLKDSGLIKKYIITEVPEGKKVIPTEIIQKKNKKDNDE